MTAIQNHIHLATTLDAATENAPIYKWSITSYTNEYLGFWNVDYTLSGKRHFQILKNAGTPVVKENYQFVIFCKSEHGYTTQERIRQLYAMRGRVAFLVPLLHPDDGENHIQHLIEVFVDEVQGEKPLDIFMDYAEVKVTLIGTGKNQVGIWDQQGSWNNNNRWS